MLMADTMAIFFVILGLMLALPALWLLCRGLWPLTVTSAASVCKKGLLKPFLVGLPIAVMAFIAVAALGNLGPAGKIGAAVLASLGLMFANCGVAGLATCVGERLASAADAGRGWRATLRGGVALELSYLLPILGWFIILPISVTIGCGAALIASLRKLLASSRSSLPEPPASVNAEAGSFGVTETIGAGR